MKLSYVRASDADKEATRRILADPGLREIYNRPVTVADMRAATADLNALSAVRQIHEDVQIASEAIAGVPCETMIPPAAAGDRFIIYLHGGAFVRGSLALGRPNASWLAALTQTTVIAIGYSQAPEHPYPAAATELQKVYAAVCSGRAPPGRIAIVGESSGGTLALGLAVAVSNGDSPAPAGIAALSPLADLDLRGSSWLTNADKDVAQIDMARRTIGQYIRPSQMQEPMASPARHHFRSCCPLLVAIGSHETMLSDAERLAQNASLAGADVTLAVYEEMPHGFTRFTTDIGTQALVDAAAWCCERLAT